MCERKGCARGLPTTCKVVLPSIKNGTSREADPVLKNDKLSNLVSHRLDEHNGVTRLGNHAWAHALVVYIGYDASSLDGVNFKITNEGRTALDH